MDGRLYRSRDDRMIAGIAGGLGDYLGIDPTLIRIGWVLLFFAGGFGLLLYIVMWIVVPEEDDLSPEELAAAAAMGASPAPRAPAGPAGASVDWRTQRAAERDARRAGRRARRAAYPGEGRTVGLAIGGFLVLVGVVFLLHNLIPAINFDLFWPIILVLLGVVILVAAFRPSGPAGPGTGGRP